MLRFELKKMWRNRTVLWLFLFTVALVFFVNYRSARIWVEDEYPFYSEYPLDLFYRTYMKTTTERYLAKVSTIEMNKDFKRMEKIGGDYFALRKKIPLHFRGYSEEELELEKIYMKQVELVDELLKKHEIPLSDSPNSDFILKWAMFEKNYAEEHGVHIINNVYSVPLTNAVQRVVFNSRFLFGMPVILCFLFLFGGILSREREQGTDELLAMQPVRKIYILRSKLLAVWCIALLYVLILGVLLLLSFLWLDLPIDGFREIYRVINPSNPLKYVVGTELLSQILLSFFMMVAFFTGLIFFISARSTDTTGTTVIILLLFAWLYVMTEKFEVFQQPWNPVYALDYLQVINGRYARVWSILREENTKVFYANGIRWYFLFGGGAVLLSVLSPLWKERKIRGEKKSQEKFSSSTVVGIEKKKLFQTTAFYRMVFGVSALLLLFFVFLKKEDENTMNIFHAAEEVTALEEMLRRENKMYRKEQQKGKMYPEPEAGKKVDPYIESLETNVRKMESYLQHEKNKRKYFSEKNATLFYTSMDKNVEKSFNGYRISENLFVHGQPTTCTQYETSAVFRKAAEENVLPVLVPNLYFSAYEEYTSPIVRSQMEKKHLNRTHSAFHLPYRLIKDYRMDIAFLIVVSLIVFGGYVFDKAYGEQLSWMYTEPVRRSRYHWTKIGVSVGFSAGIFLFFFAVVFVAGWASEGIGAWNFPIVNYLSLLQNPMGAVRREVL